MNDKNKEKDIVNAQQILLKAGHKLVVKTRPLVAGHVDDNPWEKIVYGCQ